jgi:hypothetical protein
MTHKVTKFLRPLRLDLNGVLGPWMLEPKRFGVQRDAVMWPSPVFSLSRLISGIAQNGVPYFRELNANLISSTCLQFDFEHRSVSPNLFRFKMSDRELALIR